MRRLVQVSLPSAGSRESDKRGEARDGGARPRRVGVGVDVSVRRLPRGRVGPAGAVLRHHRLVVGLGVAGGTLVQGEGHTDGLQALGLPLPGVVVGGVAHVVVDEGVLGLLVLIVAVGELEEGTRGEKRCE